MFYHFDEFYEEEEWKRRKSRSTVADSSIGDRAAKVFFKKSFFSLENLLRFDFARFIFKSNILVHFLNSEIHLIISNKRVNGEKCVDHLWNLFFPKKWIVFMPKLHIINEYLFK